MNTFYPFLCCALLINPFTNPAWANESREWDFRVLLDGKDVGSQRFVVTNQDGLTRLETEADFKVKFLFATVYRYLHRRECRSGSLSPDGRRA
jgi:hypothetical protein